MSSHLDYFSDLLEDGEQIRSTVAGPSTPENGVEGWVQLATTDSKVLAIKLQQGPLGNYQPVQRMSTSRGAVQIARYPKSDQSPARLELTGFEIPITLIHIDRPDIFPLVEPFIVSWGGRLGGSGTVRPSHQSIQLSTIDEKKLVMIAIGLLGTTIFFCGCAGILGSVIAFTKGQF
jgi:hypothetical protein